VLLAVLVVAQQYWIPAVIPTIPAAP